MKKVYLILCLFVPFLSACWPSEQGMIIGSGTKNSAASDITAFKAIQVNGQGMLRVAQQESYSIEIEADDNILPLITTEVDGDTLVITQPKNKALKPVTPIVYRVSAPHINHISSSGCFKISVPNIVQESFGLDISGSTNATLQLNVKDLDICASGSSNVEIKGTTQKQTITASGSTHIQALELSSKTANINGTGSSVLELSVEDKINGVLAGATTLHYKGDPELTVSKAGSIIIKKVN